MIDGSITSYCMVHNEALLFLGVQHYWVSTTDLYNRSESVLSCLTLNILFLFSFLRKKWSYCSHYQHQLCYAFHVGKFSKFTLWWNSMKTNLCRTHNFVMLDFGIIPPLFDPYSLVLPAVLLFSPYFLPGLLGFLSFSL